MSGLSEADREALVDVFEQRRRGINRDDLNIFAAVEAIVARHVTAALNEAADNMPVSRPDQPYEHAAGWLRRRAEALAAART